MLHVFDLSSKTLTLLLELFQVDQSLQWHVTLERFLTWKSYRCESSGVTLP